MRLFAAVSAPTIKLPESSSEEVAHNEKHGPAERAAIEAADSSNGDVDDKETVLQSRRHFHQHGIKRAHEVVNESGESAATAWLALSNDNGRAAGVMRPRTRKYARGMPGVFPAGILG